MKIENSFRAISRIRKQLLFSYTAWTKTKRNLKSKQTSNGYLRKRNLLSHLDCNDRKKWNSVSLAKRSSFNIWYSPSTVYLKSQFNHTKPLSCLGWRNFAFNLSFDMVIFFFEWIRQWFKTTNANCNPKMYVFILRWYLKKILGLFVIAFWFGIRFFTDCDKNLFILDKIQSCGVKIFFEVNP